MALGLTTDDRVLITGNLFDWNAAYSVHILVYIDTDPGWQCIVGPNRNVNVHDYFGVQATTLDWVLLVDNNSQDSGGTTSLTLDTWYDIWCIRESATQARLWVRAATSSAPHTDVAGNTTNVGARQAMQRFELGSVAGSDDLDGRLAYCHVYEGQALTEVERMQQSAIIRPTYIAGDSGVLRAFWPFWPGTDAQRLADYSGNGNNLTRTSGTLADFEPPGVPWGAAPHLLVPTADTGQNVTVGAIAAGTAVQAPTQVNRTQAVAAIPAGTNVPAVGLAFDQFVTVPAIAASSAVIAPDQVNRTQLIGTIPASSAVVAPDQVNRGQAVAAIPASAVVVAPDQVNRTQVVGAIPSATTVLAPTISVSGPQTVVVPAIASSAVVVAPDQVNRTQTVAAIAASTAMPSDLTLIRPNRTQTVAAIPASAAVVAPDQVNRIQQVGAIPSATVVLAPAISVAGDQTVVVPAIASSAVVVVPDQVNRVQTVATIAASSAVIAPVVSQETIVVVPAIAAGTAVPAPSAPARTLQVVAIAAAAAVLAPILDYVLLVQPIAARAIVPVHSVSLIDVFTSLDASAVLVENLNASAILICPLNAELS